MSAYVVSITIDSDSATFVIGTTVTPTSSVASSTYSSTSAEIIPTTATSAIFATPTATNAVSSHGHSGPSAGQIVGIILGSVIGGCLLIFLVFFFFCWKRRSRKRSGDSLSRNEKPFSRASMRRSFRLIGTNRPIQSGDEEGRTTEPGNTTRPETFAAGSLAVNPRPTRKPTRSKSRKRTGLPISAPEMGTRGSMPLAFHTRFFSEPPNIPPPSDPANQHVSDATTIRTSANPPTPITPPLVVLPTYSASTSRATSFEEDKEHQVEPVPPLPTSASATIAAARQSADAMGEQSRFSGNSIEAGIKRSISRAVTGSNGAASGSMTATPSTAPKSRSAPQPHISSSLNPRAVMEVDASGREVNTLPFHYPEAPPYLEIPYRESSLRDFGAETRRELSLPSRSQLTLIPESPRGFRPPPNSVRKHSKKGSQSSSRKITYPAAPKSTSAETVSFIAPESEAQLTRSNTRHDIVSMEDVAKYTSKPLPAIGNSESTFASTSSSTLALRKTITPSRLRLPPINQEPLEIFPPTYYVQPEAIFTPNRTSTGDIVLHVDHL